MADRSRAFLVRGLEVCLLGGAFALGFHCGGSSPEPRPPASASASSRPPRRPPKTGTLAGHVRFTGVPPKGEIPPKRREAELCKDVDIADAPVTAARGLLRDAFVRVTDVEGRFEVPASHAEIDQIDCVMVPRVVGAMAGQTIDIHNSDGTLHNVHAYRDGESLFNQALIKEWDPLAREAGEPGIMVLTCDLHPWTRGYVVISPHPFFDVTGPNGAFWIEEIPVGKHVVEAWHPALGSRQATVEIDTALTRFDFVFDASDLQPEPSVVRKTREAQ